MKLAHVIETRYRPLTDEWYVTSVTPDNRNEIGSFPHLEDAVKAATDMVSEITGDHYDPHQIFQQIKETPKGYWQNDKGEPIWEVGSDELSVLITRNRYGTMYDIWTQTER